jgi:hypothetical protein
VLRENLLIVAIVLNRIDLKLANSFLKLTGLDARLNIRIRLVY